MPNERLSRRIDRSDRATPHTLIDLLEQAVARFGDRLALTLEDPETPEVWTYRAFGAAVERVAARLAGEWGIQPGDRVLAWGSNSPRLAIAYLGCMRAGAVLVPIDPQTTVEFVERVAARTEATAIVLAADRTAPGGIRGIPLAALTADPGDASAARVDHRPAADDLAEIVFTSGTTGEPKGVMLTHGNIVSNVQAIDGVIPRGPEYRLLSLLPLSHMLEQTGGLFMPMTYGAAISYTTSRQPATLFGVIKEHRVTTMIVVPLVLDIMMRGIEREVRRAGAWSRWQWLHRVAARLPIRARRVLFSRVRRQIGPSLDFFFCGGARLAPELARAWERMGIRVVEGYGATECAPVVTANTLGQRVLGSIGRPVRGVDVRLADDGELQVRGPNVTGGYWRDPAATAAAFSSGGWYRTGDLAGRLPNGGLALRGRLRDLIVLPNGMNVYPEDVEAEIRSQPGIADCVVVGRPDARGDVSVHAVLLPARGEDEASPAASLAAAIVGANARLARHQRVTSHERWPDEDFPRTTSMKVKRREVASRVSSRA